MEDKKRVHSGEEPSNEQPVAKRQNVDNDSKVMTQDDVLDFQKEAIWRQMQVYKREREIMSTEIDQIKEQNTSLKASFSTLDVWWDQLMDQLLPKTEEESETIPPTLLFNAVGGSNLGSVLEKKNSMIKERLGPVFKNLGSLDAAKLQESLANLSSMLNRLRAENDGLKVSRDDLQKRTEEIKEKYLVASKKLDRNDSNSLNKILQASTMANKDEPKSAEKEEGSNKVSEETLKEMETIKTGFDELQSVNSKQKKQLEEQDGQIVKLRHKVQDLSQRLSNIPAEDLRNSDHFQSLRMQRDDFSSQVSRLEHNLHKADQEVARLRSTSEQFKSSVKKQYEKEREALEKENSKLEADVLRIRQARDQMLGELNEKKAVEKEKSKSHEEFQDLLKIREERIKVLEKEVERFTASSAEIDPNGESDPEKLKQIAADMQKQNKSLLIELQGIEEAFSDAHAKATAKIYDAAETENRVKKLSAEKAKADEKYFSAMRSKDALSQELAKLKQQLTKSTETLTQLREQDRKRGSQIDDMEQQVQKEVQLKRSREDESHNLQRRMAEMDDQLKAAHQRIVTLNANIAARDEDMQKEAMAKRETEVQMAKLKRQADTKNFLSTGNGGEESQLQELRTMTLCSVCKRNFKNTTIRGCGHCLCNDCAQDRLNARMRKCPMCNKPYSSTDLVTIVL